MARLALKPKVTERAELVTKKKLVPRVPTHGEVVESAAEYENVRKISTGSHLLDLVLGGGWAVGRVVNVVGDKSSGKTLLAIEASANFDLEIGGNADDIRYAEAEAAFDRGYAQSIGMPDSVEFASPPIQTVEEFDADLTAFLKKKKKRKLGLYVLDSLDALSDDAEMERDIGDASYGGTKPKKMSEMFRRRIAEIERCNVTVFIISQIRDKLNVKFGETKTRSGGRALDFYATQIIWLVEIGKIYKTVMGEKRAIGVKVLVKCKKNKVGIGYRECTINVYFNYGVDDEESMMDWLKAHPAAGCDEGQLKTMRAQLTSARRVEDRRTIRVINRNLKGFVTKHWEEIERQLAPPMKKYGRK